MPSIPPYCTGGVIHLTPSRVPYETMRARDIVTVDEHGASRRGRRSPSREMPMHLAIHAARRDVRAIVHTHTPHAVAWSMLAPELSPETEDSHYFSTGTIRVAPARPAGSRVLAVAAVRQLGSGRAVLLERHGAVSVGEDVPAAMAVAEAPVGDARIRSR